MPPTVTTAFAGRLGQSVNSPLAAASRTAFSISRWAVTPNVLRNLRTLVLRVSSSMGRSFLDTREIRASLVRNTCGTDRIKMRSCPDWKPPERIKTNGKFDLRQGVDRTLSARLQLAHLQPAIAIVADLASYLQLTTREFLRRSSWPLLSNRRNVG